MESHPISDAKQVPVAAMKQRLSQLMSVIVFINDTAPYHKDHQSFMTVLDFILSQPYVSPVALAKAFEVNTATVSRWRSGKNAPHPRERPAVIAWLKQELEHTMRHMKQEIEEICGHTNGEFPASNLDDVAA